ncbi:nucleoprotein TPR isoform X5 [Aricia agestis]|uniref:nucleoprotein TPR isoform X5 n=1 Tax=Aricia agestis TaxID=91739 RepID=UPI001C202E98|nr:nucleoprotein TPR isoform X5 [Aricia agestis]
MHHMYPGLAKGDPLCPLGFHPQVRWPTRCKRCFRDYKEHGGRKKEDDIAASTPTLSTWNSPSSRNRDEDNGTVGDKVGRSWASSSNLSTIDPSKKDVFSTGLSNTKTAWTSTPDIADDSTNEITVSLKLPKRRSTGPLPSLDTGQNSTGASETVTLRRQSPSPPSTTASIVITKNDSLAERVRKMQLIKAQNSFEKESSVDKERERRSTSRSKDEDKLRRSSSRGIDDEKLSKTPEEKPKVKEKLKDEKGSKKDERIPKEDVTFLIQVKNNRSSSYTKPPIRGGPSRDEKEASDDEASTTGTTTDTDTTLVDQNLKEYQEQIESLKQELDIMKKRCERVEKEKSDILLRRLANIDTTSKYSTGRSSEVLKLQQKVNELTSQNEDLKDEKKHLSLKIKEMEAEVESRPSAESQTRQIEQLRAKLLAAETLCEELMDENEDMKKELRDLEEEIEEMQDNFREDQADEYSSLRRELEQTIKNCRVLSFKLKKTERRADQLEQEKADQEKKLLEIVGGAEGLQRENRIKELEKEVSRTNEVAQRLQRELAEANSKLASATGAPNAKKPTETANNKVSRASLTRGGSQEDPAQLLRDLQDSLEREADLREQLRNAEEEANNLRKTASRVEDDNESLLLQLKKMATKARSRKLSPTPPTNRLAIEAPNEKDEGISDEEDPAELRILLELNEQEATVLRKKVEDLEQDRDSLRKQVKELTDKISNATTKTTSAPTATFRRNVTKTNNLAEEKVKVLEDEIAELRKKLIEKERDCERLHAELSLAQKKPKASLIKSKSLDASNDTQNVDLKRQLQVIEQEASVLRAKTQTLEADNEKLQAENKKLQLLKNVKTLKTDKSQELSANKITKLETELKEALDKIKTLENSRDREDKTEKKVRFGADAKKETDALKLKQDELDKLKINFDKLEKEKVKLQTTLKELKEDAIKSFKPRKQKIVTDITTKLQMKKMIDDLESEIGELYVIMKNAQGDNNVKNSKIANDKELENLKVKLSKAETDFTNEKNKLQNEIGKLKVINAKLEADKTSISNKYKTLEDESNKSILECKTLKDENKSLETQITKLNTEIKKFSTQQTAVSDCMKKVEDLKKEMDAKDKEIDKLKKLVENVNKLEQDKSKLLKEVGDKTKKINDLEKKLKEAEDKCKRTEKQLSLRKDRVSKLEKEEDALRETSNQKYDEAISSVEIAQLKDKCEAASKELKKKEDELSSLKTKLSKTEESLINLQKEYADVKSVSSKLESEKKDLETKIQAEKKDATYWESKASDLDTDLQAERKKVDRMRISHDKDIKNKEAELATLKGKLKVLEQTSGAGAKRIAELKQDHEEKVKKLEHSLAVEKAEYEELTGKYELLEEEHVVTKARLTVEKEKAQADLLHIQQELNTTLAEMKSLQNNYENQSSGWNKEKSELQEQISSLQERLCGGGWEVERSRMSAKMEQTEKELRDATDELDVLRDTHQYTKKELEEARRKLDDYEKVTKIHRTLTADNEELERELSSLNKRLEQSEKARKTEIADIKSRYEGQMDTMREELKSLHNQVSRFRRERDNYKQMMEEAQKSAKDERGGKKPRPSISSTDEDEYRNKVAVLEQQLACLEDELCESRLLASKLNTELVSERSAAEVRLSEMQSRLNEYEEDRLLNSGRSRVTGMATRMELAWHKERDELQRLVQETSTLARDLRQTLFEVEREREKERLDMKRRIDQLKRTTEEETEDAKKKVTELQCDLLELRDAHAKLRTANEKLRRDKERHDRDRDQHRLLVSSLKRSQQDDDNVITQLLETIDEMMAQTPELFPKDEPKPPEKRLMTPTPPRRNRSSASRSRSTTPEGGAGGGAVAGARLRRLADELRASRIGERQRRHAASARRAMSTEPREALSAASSRPAQRNSSLKKRSISLEQTTKDQNAIWKSVDESSVSSMQSLDDDARFTVQRDASLDSRLSGGSAASDVLPNEKKKKKGLFGKLKKLTKSRSIDDHVDDDGFRPIGTVSRGSDSDMSTTGSRRDLRGRLSDMFSRHKPPSRANSKEQSPERASNASNASSTSVNAAGTRPILRNASTSALTRASPVKPADSPSSRATSVTPGIKRKGK